MKIEIIFWKLLKKRPKNCFVPLTVGGGVRTLQDISNLLNSGADKVSINTAAVQNTNIVKEGVQKFGSQCITVAVDAKKVDNNKWEVFTHGGRNSSGKDVMHYVKEVEKLGAERDTSNFYG